MDSKEIKEALFAKCPVVYNGIKYKLVYEIKYCVPDDKLFVSAGLMDYNGNCIVYAPINKVQHVKEANGEQA